MMITSSDDDIETLRCSVEEFGFGFLSNPLASPVLQELQAEADERYKAAVFAEQSEGLNYRARITSLGPEATRLLCGPQMTTILNTLFGEKFVLTQHRSCLTFYGEGDHLGPHLDMPAEECVVTIIVYISATESALQSALTGLELRVYGRELGDALNPVLTIPTRTGNIVIGRGSKVWHERPMLQEGEAVAALTGCYGHSAT